MCIKDKFPVDLDNLPDPDVLVQEIVKDLKAALEQFREIAPVSQWRRAYTEKSENWPTINIGIVLVKPFTMVQFLFTFVLIALKRTIQS